MFFRNDTIWSEFPKIQLHCDPQDDEETMGEDDIKGVQINNNPEFESREGENSEEDEFSNKNSVVFTNTEISNSNPDPIQEAD